MSVLVTLDKRKYPRHALEGLSTTSTFDPKNAPAMMWLSQLAYETEDRGKVEDILKLWGLELLAFKDDLSPSHHHNARVVVAGTQNTTFVLFSGTDPLRLEDWILDFDAGKSVDDVHGGFEEALDSVWPDVTDALASRVAERREVFFTGHSLGGALAIVAAERAIRTLGIEATAVYTFGSPRVGGSQFFGRYKKLSDKTFRLVHGTDVVATVPPTGEFLHVGECRQCLTDGRFVDPSTTVSAVVQNKPDFIEEALRAGLADFRAATALRFFRRIGPGLLNRLAALLPRMVRDHVPTNYFRALGVKL
jgi:triacylglycerol lipase